MLSEYWAVDLAPANMKTLKAEQLVLVESMGHLGDLSANRRLPGDWNGYVVKRMIEDGLVEDYGDGGFKFWAPAGMRSNFGSVDLFNKMSEFAGYRLMGAEVADTLVQAITLPKSRSLIPAFREVREANGLGTPGPSTSDLDRGTGLIKEIALWQHPNLGDTQFADYCRRRFQSLKDFLQVVLEDPDADLEVPHDASTLNVRLRQSGQWLPLDAVGDGIKQVIMLAAAATRQDQALICLEEPEIHLHPGLQRKLMRYLSKTSNQYLVATHSAHLLDTPGAAVFHVTHHGTSTCVAPAIHTSQMVNLSQDMGYLASDLLQTNYTIWVEGPSDRLYWRRWLSLVDSDLVEGEHYMIMNYGGKLVSSLSLEPEALKLIEEDLIRILHLGRRCTLIADSDKTSADASLSPTLVRLKEEAKSSGTAQVIIPEWCRTVENMVPEEVLLEGLRIVHPQNAVGAFGSRGNPYAKPINRAGEDNFGFRKVRLANEVASRLNASQMSADLLHAVTQLATQIRLANGMDVPIVVWNGVRT